MDKPYSVDYWYRHSDDPDQSLRDVCQMMAGATCRADIDTEISNLRAQGYTVQKVVLRVCCARCESAGKLKHYPKGTRKDRRHTVPAWRMVYTECPTCKGEGFTHSEEITLPPLVCLICGGTEHTRSANCPFKDGRDPRATLIVSHVGQE